MTEQSKHQLLDPKNYIGRRVKLLRDHPWAGESAEVVDFDTFGMRVKLLRRDAMYGHECYVTKKDQFRPEREGVDW